MCIIIVADKLSDISNTAIKCAMRANPHGSSFALMTDKGVAVHRFISKSDQAIATRDKLIKMHGNGVGIFHARIATAGKIDVINAHPFRVHGNKRVITAQGKAYYIERELELIAHNGMLSGFGDDKHSDTVDFIARVYSQIDRRAGNALLRELGKFVTLDPVSRKVLYHGVGWQSRAILETGRKVHYSNSSAFDYVPAVCNVKTTNIVTKLGSSTIDGYVNGKTKPLSDYDETNDGITNYLSTGCYRKGRFDLDA